MVNSSGKVKLTNQNLWRNSYFWCSAKYPCSVVGCQSNNASLSKLCWMEL